MRLDEVRFAGLFGLRTGGDHHNLTPLPETGTVVAEREADESVDVDMTDENADTPALELDE